MVSSAFAVEIVSLFPEMFAPFLEKGLLGQAVQNGKLTVEITNPRKFTTDVHHTVDDRPYGGGDGMIMLAEPLEKSVTSIHERRGTQGRPPLQVIYLSPQGEPLTDKMARDLAAGPGMILISGRYGGVDERFLSLHVDREISIGDFVLNGGEVAALAVLEAASRFLPGVLGNSTSADRDSFADGLLEAPQMTRPAEYGGMTVPAVLTSGNHQSIAAWRRQMAVLRTYFRRPDLAKSISEAEVAGALRVYGAMSEDERRACGLPETHS